MKLSEDSLNGKTNDKNKFQATNVLEVQENVLENDSLSGISRTNVQENGRINALLALIKQNPNITLKTLSEKLNVTSKTIQRDLEQLKQNAIVERTGSDRKGQWKIIKG